MSTNQNVTKPASPTQIRTKYSRMGLSEGHEQVLKARAISPEVSIARGYATITDPKDLADLGFSVGQQRLPPGLLIPIHDVEGQKGAVWQFRPDEPDGDRKYELRAGDKPVLDIPPSALPHLKDINVPLFVTESPLKADSGISNGLKCCIAVLGVSNWKGKGWTSIELDGRIVYLVFDNDYISNPQVRAMLRQLKDMLEKRNAEVHIIKLPSDSKGLDDYFANDGTAEGLLELEDTDPFPTATKRTKQATQLVQLVQDAELFHTARRVPYVYLEGQTYEIGSADFKHLLGDIYFAKYDDSPSEQALRDAVNTLSGRAQHRGRERKVYRRVAWTRNAIYIDLADKGHHVVKITPNRWTVFPGTARVRFRHLDGMEALPIPVRGGNLEDLRKFLNVKNDNDWYLFVASLTMILWLGPYPIITFHGPSGSGKSSAVKVIVWSTDPREGDLLSKPRSEDDMATTVYNSWLTPFDNLSHLNLDYNDFLCRRSTGGVYTKRKNFADTDPVSIDLYGPTVLAGIEEVITRDDALARAVILRFLVLVEKLGDKEFERRFKRARPAILGALYTLIARALQELPKVPKYSTHRMPEFVRWGIAIERAAGWPEGSFLAAYEDNQSHANELVLEASPVAEALLWLLEDEDQLEDTALGLLTKLTSAMIEISGGSIPRGQPGNARSLKSTLQRLTPNFQKIGVEISERKTMGRKLIKVTDRRG
jgi:hypothetical protein